MQWTRAWYWGCARVQEGGGRRTAYDRRRRGSQFGFADSGSGGAAAHPALARSARAATAGNSGLSSPPSAVEDVEVPVALVQEIVALAASSERQRAEEQRLGAEAAERLGWNGGETGKGSAK